MKKSIILVVFILLGTVGFSQKRIILKKGCQRAGLIKEKYVGITLKGDSFVFSGWKSGCDYDSTTVYNLWIVDSIKKNYMVVKRVAKDSPYLWDTIKLNKKGYEISRTHPNDTNEWDVDTVYKSNGIKTIISSRPLKFDRQTVVYDSIASLTFTKTECREYRVRAISNIVLGLACILVAPLQAYVNKTHSVQILALFITVGVLDIYYGIKILGFDKAHRYKLSEWEFMLK